MVKGDQLMNMEMRSTFPTEDSEGRLMLNQNESSFENIGREERGKGLTNCLEALSKLSILHRNKWVGGALITVLVCLDRDHRFDLY